jgi:hypothetical protein
MNFPTWSTAADRSLNFLPFGPTARNEGSCLKLLHRCGLGHPFLGDTGTSKTCHAPQRPPRLPARHIEGGCGLSCAKAQKWTCAETM